ncbi:hypothetical protein V5F38_12180 [Xanthobacter sp. V0B-10]|uniref:hypothetical protein n=1 Tax=Xanthobacter albus TaxID=3119929 RepID=UPI0037292702
MLSEILARLTGKKAPTSRDLETALTKIDLQALREQVLAAEAARREALIGGATDADLDRHDTAVTGAQKALERAQIARNELTVRLAEAREREVAEALTRERDEAEAEAKACAEELRVEWVPHQRELLRMLGRLQAAEERVREVNLKLGEAGRGDETLRPVEWRVRSVHEILYAPAYSISVQTILPAIPDWDLDGYGAVATFYVPPLPAPEMHAPKGEAPRPIIYADNGTN